jgi:hypothetical protein
LDRRALVTPGQLVSVLVMASLAGGVYVWPSWLIRLSGPDTMWGLGASLAVAAIAMVLRLGWGRVVPGSDYVSRLRATYGAVLAWPLWAVERAMMLLLDGTLLSLYGNLLRAAFYPRTPTAILIIMITAAGVWIGSRPAAADVARNVLFWSLLLGASLAFLFLLAMPLGHNWLLLVPPSNIHLAGVVGGISLTGYLWAQDEVLFTFGSAMAGGLAKSGRWAFVSVAVSGVLLVLLLSTTLAILGPEAVAHLYWPIVYMFSVLVLNISIISHIGIFVLFLWTVGMIMYGAIRSYSATVNTAHLMGWDEDRRRWLLLGHGTAVVAVAMVLQGTLEASTFLETVLSPVTVYGGIAFLVVSLAWVSVRRRWTTPSPRRGPPSGASREQRRRARESRNTIV